MRLFVALALPAEVRASLADASAPLRETFGPAVSWTDAAKLHVTVQFIGEADDRLAEALGAALRDAAGRVAPFALRLRGVGAFPTPARARILWMGIDPNPTLAALYQEVTGATARLGVPTEPRPFHPHVTLGRVRPGRRIDGRRLADLAGAIPWTASAPVRTVDLMESTLGPGGARYRPLEAAPLGTLTTEV